MDSSYDVVIVGAGTAGSVVASRLSEIASVSVCLIEAGRDYGPRSGSGWPGDLLDWRTITPSHEWERQAHCPSRRGRVVGGSSTGHACIATWGPALDYDEWDPLSHEKLAPFMAMAEDSFKVVVCEERLTPWHAAFAQSLAAFGIPEKRDFNEDPSSAGVGRLVMNVRDGVRWNASFAYLDRVRHRPNLSIAPDAVVDRVELSDGRAVGVILDDGSRIVGRSVVIAAGAYGSPAILLRSGIGPRTDLRRLGIDVIQELPVGTGLTDHPSVAVEWSLSESTQRMLTASCPDRGWASTQIGARYSTGVDKSVIPDLHIFPHLVPARSSLGYRAFAVLYRLKPASSGSVSLVSRDPNEPPSIDHGFVSNPSDAAVLSAGVQFLQNMTANNGIAAVVEREAVPGARKDVGRHVRETVRSAFHPTGTCALGRVVDETSAVYGVPGLHVIDASVMPTIPRANTNLSTAALAEYLAHELLTQDALVR